MNDTLLADLYIALASDTDQPQVTFRALERLVDQTIGVRLFTLMELDRTRGVAWRGYSNMPDAYPTAGEKPMLGGAWLDQVEQKGEIFVANTLDEIAAVFPDYELIDSLGCQSCINIPIFIEGTLRGTLNCLHRAHYYTAERVAAAEQLRLAGAVAFLVPAAARCRLHTPGPSGEE